MFLNYRYITGVIFGITMKSIRYRHKRNSVVLPWQRTLNEVFSSTALLFSLRLITVYHTEREKWQEVDPPVANFIRWQFCVCCCCRLLSFHMSSADCRETYAYDLCCRQECAIKKQLFKTSNCYRSKLKWKTTVGVKRIENWLGFFYGAWKWNSFCLFVLFIYNCPLCCCWMFAVVFRYGSAENCKLKSPCFHHIFDN